MTDTTAAKIAAKGCSATGITEELAIKLHDQLGKKVMAVVELEAAARTEDSDGNQKVQLRILSVEPATEKIAEDHLREFQRALYYNRQLDDAQPTLGDGPEPTVKDVLGRGESLLDRDDDGNPVLWDGTDDELEEEDDEDQGEDQEDEGPSRDRPHRYIDTAHATCGHTDCGLPAGAEIHTILGPVPA